MLYVRLALFFAFCVFGALGFAAQPTGIGLRTFATGLSQPIAMSQSLFGHFYVAERTGKIRILNSSGGIMAFDPFDVAIPSFSCRWLGLDTPMRVVVGSEGGLLNLALDPDFQSNGRIYFYYTTADSIVLARLRTDPFEPRFFLPDSCEALLRLPVTPGIHIGGFLAFGGDGLLYLGIGNTATGCEQYLAPSQAPGCLTAGISGTSVFNPNAGMFRGKILRLDVNTTQAAGHTLCGVPTVSAALYSTPPSNLFGPVDKCPEIFAYGVRNPWRGSVDRSTGDVLIGDVGEGGPEELSVLRRAPAGVPAGANLGWPCFEGFRPASSFGPCQSLAFANTHQPVAEFNSIDGFRSIVGGYRYRGPETAFNGLYLGADVVFNRGKIVVARPEAIAPVGQAQPQWRYAAMTSAQLFEVSQPLQYVVSLAQDRAGNLYTMDFSGAIQQFSFNADVEFQNRFE
jgi:glucose/arabinose dehydrogenase